MNTIQKRAPRSPVNCEQMIAYPLFRNRLIVCAFLTTILSSIGCAQFALFCFGCLGIALGRHSLTRTNAIAAKVL